MLIVGEVSEAAEEIRKGPQTYGYLVDWDGTKPEGFDIELADVFLRLADLAEACGIDLYRAVSAKHEYNKTRPRLHGKKL
jgi:NTP pyrophosphatase (non-canonical NTP hydrolase)